MPGVGLRPRWAFNFYDMYKLIHSIAERSHATAVKRGQDVSTFGCIAALRTEQQEYWQAVDKGAEVADIRVLSAEANKLPDAEFTALYETKIHNTASDELADILITAATWLHTAETGGGEDFDPDRSIDAMLLSGAVQFVCNRITGNADVERVQLVTNLKLRFNELREG